MADASWIEHNYYAINIVRIHFHNHVTSSKCLLHNVFVNFVINLEITKILFTKLEVTGWPSLNSMLTEKWVGQN